MKIRGNRYRLVKKAPEPDPEEVARAAWWAESAANIQRLKAQGDALARERSELWAKLGYDVDWLCYLPASAGDEDFIGRACAYLEKMRQRVEAEGAQMWLCKDHDFVTRVVNVREFRAMNGAVFCSGKFTDKKYRDSFKGISPDFATFAGDIDLVRELGAGQPPDTMTMDDLPAHTRIAAKSPAIFGLAGAACIDIEPCYGRSRIFRITRRGIE
jgi:hypothetical protein